MNHGYRASPLEGFALDLAALVGVPVFCGDYEAWRAKGYRTSPVCLTVPEQGIVAELASVTDRREETQPFAELTETVDMAVYATDYTACRALIIRIWRALDGWSVERDDIAYRIGLTFGQTRRATGSSHVPADGFTFVDRVTLTSLLSAQDASLVAAEVAQVTGSLYISNVLQGTVTSNA
jgi:hypothetical protein